MNEVSKRHVLKAHARPVSLPLEVRAVLAGAHEEHIAHQAQRCSVDVAFDKGTLDAMIFGSPWSPPEETLENSGRYMKEVRLFPSYFAMQSKHGLTSLGSTCSERRWLLSIHHLPATALHQTHFEP